MKKMRTCAPVDLEDETERKRFFECLLKALHDRDGDSYGMSVAFAGCQCLERDQLSLKSLQVHGAGKLNIPLCPDSASKLRSACEQEPFGRGRYYRKVSERTACVNFPGTVRDAEVRPCWQVDSSKVTFPEDPTFLSVKVQDLAAAAVHSHLRMRGIWMQGMEAHFDRLLLHERGGHFTFRRDTEKEKWMFGTLIVQIPMIELYTGGKQVVKHHNVFKEFNCSGRNSRGYCYTVFYADCLHELQEIKTGSRLCLVFNLVWRGRYTEIPTAARLRAVRVAMAPWFKAVTDVNRDFIKLGIPLDHKYTRANLAFNTLKGQDAFIAAVMKAVQEDRSDIHLDLYLCLVVKGTAPNNSVPLEEGSHERGTFENVIGLDNKPSFRFVINGILDTEIVSKERDPERDPFHLEPGRKEYEEEPGNDSRTFEYQYHSAMLIVHPRPRHPRSVISLSLASGVDQGDSIITSNTQSRLPAQETCRDLFVPITNVATASTVANEAGLRKSKRGQLEGGEVSGNRKQTAMSPALKSIERSDLSPGSSGGGDGQTSHKADEKGKTKLGETKACESSDDVGQVFSAASPVRSVVHENRSLQSILIARESFDDEGRPRG